jgi:hypothetical protein
MKKAGQNFICPAAFICPVWVLVWVFPFWKDSEKKRKASKT